LQMRVTLDQPFLWHYGVTRVPHAIWDVLRRMSAWIEPMLVAEWIRLTQAYAQGLGKPVAADQIMLALQWLEPRRDTEFVRAIADAHVARGQTLACVWSGRPLTRAAFDIDHCLPWSAWACGDLWNLLPASPAINRHDKRERLVTGAALRAAKPLITAWWQTAYLDAAPALRSRFAEEARATLPIGDLAEPQPDDIFLALDFRRLRLQQDTQVTAWNGVVGATDQ